MKFIELHEETYTFWVKTDTIEMIERGTPTTKPCLSSFIRVGGFGYYCRETPEEIFQKIAEAEQCERSFMDDWKDEVDDQLGRLRRLTVKKDGATDATDRW